MRQNSECLKKTANGAERKLGEYWASTRMALPPKDGHLAVENVTAECFSNQY